VTGRFLIDATDARFRIPANDDVIEFIRRANPFAHPDVGSLLLELGRDTPGAHAYCPSFKSCAYVVLHTDADVIFAIAFGQRGLAFRVPDAERTDALADGGVVAPEIGPAWVRFEPWDSHQRAETHARLERWCERALAAAIQHAA
jgi:hypothetical protein